MKIRVLHLLNDLTIGGAEILLLQIIKALDETVYEHFVYYFGIDGPIRNKLLDLNIPVWKGNSRNSIKRPIKFIRSLKSHVGDLISYINKNDIQIIHAHLDKANQLASIVSKLTGIPAFLTVHSPEAFVDSRKKTDFRVYFKKAMNQLLYRHSDRVLVVSREIKEKVQQIFSLSEKKIIVLKNGIVFDGNLTPYDFSRDYPCSKNKLRLIAVGRLVPLKSFDIFIKAIAEIIHRGYDNLFACIAGEGIDRLRLERLIHDLGVERSVVLLGLRHDILELMKASDIFVMPSQYEGLSIAMIEAMGCGLPIIASDARGLKDYITDNENGLLFNVGDHKDLADKILQLANNENLRKNLSECARKSFEREYDMRQNIKVLDKLFKGYAWGEKQKFR